MTKSELCTYCFNARTLEGPNAEEVPCPSCSPLTVIRAGMNPIQLAFDIFGVEYTGQTDLDLEDF